MKKQLFTLLSALSLGTAVAQVTSPDWTTLQSPSFTIPTAGIRFIDAIDANVVWASGYNGLAGSENYNFFTRTIDGGANWVSGNIWPDTNTYRLASLEAIDANTAWATAYKKATDAGGAIFRTTNGGSSWQDMTATGMYTNTAAFGNWVSFVSPLVGVANGDPVNGEFELWRTTDGGTSWSQISGSNIPDPLSGEYAIVDLYTSFGPSHIWFGTNKGRVYGSADAGQTWTVAQVPASLTPTAAVIEVRFASATNGLALVSQSNSVTLYNTYDGGATWNAIPGTSNGVPANYGTNETAAIPGTNWFASVGNIQNPQTFFAGISYSKDNGLTWIDWGSTDLPYVSIDFADRWHGWAGGFTDVPDANFPGITKYDGKTFNSVFSIPSSICMGSSNATISPVNTSSSNITPYTFLWSSSPVAVFSSNTASVPVITFNSVGFYTVSLAVSDANGTGTSTQVIEVASCSLPQAAFTMTDTGCNSAQLTLTNTSTGGPAPTVTITTNPSANVQIVDVGSNQYKLQFNDPGTYTVHMAASSISGNSTAQQVVTINDCKPYANFTMQDIVCRKRSTGGADTVFIVPSIISSTLYPVQQYTWTLAPINVGISSFPNTNNNVPPGKMIILSTSPQTYSLNLYTVTLRVSNQYGATEYSEQVNVTVDNCVGLEEQGGWTSVVGVFPNPAHDKITVSVPANIRGYNVRVINLLGAVVLSERSENTGGDLELDLSGVKKGVYFVQIENSGTTVTRKFIVE